MTRVAPGRWEARIDAGENGVWHLENGDLSSVAVLGPSQPREFTDPVSTARLLRPVADATSGGILRLEETPGVDVRMTRENRVAAGRGWIGLVDREAYLLRSVRQAPLLPGWLLLLISGLLIVAAWRVEGR